MDFTCPLPFWNSHTLNEVGKKTWLQRQLALKCLALIGLTFWTDLSDFPVASPVLLFSIAPPYRQGVDALNTLEPAPRSREAVLSEGQPLTTITVNKVHKSAVKELKYKHPAAVIKAYLLFQSLEITIYWINTQQILLWQFSQWKNWFKVLLLP